MGLLQDLRGLNAAYAEVHASMQEDQDKGYVVTAADKKGNTKAWQGYKSGVKRRQLVNLYTGLLIILRRKKQIENLNYGIRLLQI